jgi:hypothetical protein
MMRAEIEENCETLIWITTGIFLISIFLSILRPDPTLAVCLFGFYGAHTRSRGAIRAFWLYLLVSVLIDGLWLYQYSALQPFTWQQMQQMTRREQAAVALTAVNILYKLVVIGIGARLQMLLGAFEAAEGEGRTVPGASPGVVISPGRSHGPSLASQDAMSLKSN